MRHMYVVEATHAAIAERPRVRCSPRHWCIWTARCGSRRMSMSTTRRVACGTNHVWWLATRDRPVPDAKVAIYPFKRSFTVGSDATDVQSGVATMCYLPGAGDAGARMLVHQHGRGGQGFLHHRRDGARGELLARHNAKDSERWRNRPMRRNMTSVAWATLIGELRKVPIYSVLQIDPELREFGETVFAIGSERTYDPDAVRWSRILLSGTLRWTRSMKQAGCVLRSDYPVTARRCARSFRGWRRLCKALLETGWH